MIPVNNQLTLNFEGSDGQLYFTIDPDIVNVIISYLFFDPKDSKELVTRATAVIKGKDGAASYYVQIKQIKIFRLVIHYVIFGTLFCFVSRQVAAAHKELKLGYFLGYNKTKVSTVFQVALAANMQTLKGLLAGCWVFSLMFDSATVESTSLFHIHLRFAAKGRLLCFHLISTPLVGQHTS